MGACSYLSRAGVSVPRQISVLGFDNSAQAQSAGLTLWLDPARLTIHRMVQHDAQGRKVHALQARAFEDHDGVPLPRRIGFERFGEAAEVVTIKVRRAVANPELTGDPFEYTPPEGTLMEWVN